MNAASSATRWRAIVDRDPSINSFVYAVRTTRIYCRPSCPARLARRANVEFYDSPAQAEKAGYRSCKRCKPQLHVLVDPNVAIVQRACEMISSSRGGGKKPRLHELAAEANLTPSHFHRVFKKIVGVTPGQYGRGGGGGGAEGGGKGKVATSSSSSSKVGSRGSPKENESSRDSSYNSSPAIDLGFDTSITGGYTGGNVSVEGQTIDWNEFDAMLATVGSPGRALDWGTDSMQLSSLGNVTDADIENVEPLSLKGSLSLDMQPSYEDALDNMPGDVTGSMTELLRGSYPSEGLEPSTTSLSPYTFDQSEIFWNEEGISRYR
ncbi:hypothetical protein FQN54_007535 [Arachnomyces sp. PD_36]|nr:hypothetical protein FQN54_007535 [Arachnomyces sp. PD_36]